MQSPTTLKPLEGISMCIYCGTEKYRKIYENHFGRIPIDEDGRSYEIHHLDGNHSNNNPSNLKAVSIQEHYNIHFLQKDWAACLIMAKRLEISPTEKSELARLSIIKRMEDPLYVCPLSKRSDGSSVASDRYKNGYRIPVRRGKENNKYDPIVYKFENVKTGEIIECTKNELKNKFSLSPSRVSLIFKDRSKTHKGWRLYSPIPYVKTKIKRKPRTVKRILPPKDRIVYHFVHEDGTSVMMSH